MGERSLPRDFPPVQPKERSNMIRKTTFPLSGGSSENSARRVNFIKPSNFVLALTEKLHRKGFHLM